MEEIFSLDWPRLSGKLWYGPPHYWRIMSTDDTIEIISAKTPRGLLVFFAVLAVAVVAGTQLVLSRLPVFPYKGWALAASAVPAIGLILAGVFLRVTYAREQARGPILVISFVTKEIKLPRAGKSWQFERIVRWEIISGFWVRRVGEKPFFWGDQISELQMLVKNNSGNISAWPIIGELGGPHTSGKSALKDAAKIIAGKMGVPLIVTVEKRKHETIKGVGSLCFSPEESKS